MTNFFRKNISAVLLAVIIFTFIGCGGNSQKKSAAESDSTQTAQAEFDTTAAPGTKLNMNTASGDEFRQIPNVGDRMVHEFEEYRPYVSIQQFRKEIGKYVNDQQVAAYENYIYVPIDPNSSDLQTLLQIPGLDEDEAQKLIDGRPYGTNQSFFDSLATSISDEELAVVKQYIKSN